MKTIETPVLISSQIVVFYIKTSKVGPFNFKIPYIAPYMMYSLCPATSKSVISNNRCLFHLPFYPRDDMSLPDVVNGNSRSRDC